jgi:PAS domain S-box-containing protein
MAEKRTRILFVDDDRVDQMAFKRFVREQNLPYDYVVAASAAEAKAALTADTFDIAIVDYLLGDGTAFDLIQYVRSVPMIFVTGSGNETVAVKALKAGAADYLIKDPARNYLNVLPTTVENALRRMQVVEQVLKLTHAVEQSPATVMITDGAGRIEYVNPRFTQLTGYTPEEVIGQNPRILKSGEHPPEFYRELWETVVAGREWHGELHNRRKDGSLFWERATISPLRNQAGAITHFVAVTEDVTERRQAEAALVDREARLRLMLEQMPAVLWTTDTELRFTSSVGAGLARLGLRPGQVVGMSLYSYFQTRDPEAPPIAAHLRALKGVSANYVQEWGDNAYDTAVEPLHDVEGRIIGTIGVAEDITDLKRAEREREKLIQELDAFSHTVAHDLNNPLSAVLGFSDFLNWEGAGLDQRELGECLRQIRQSAHKMKSIIDELLLLAGVRQTDVEPEALNMADVVAGALQRLSYMVEEHHPEIVMPESWPQARGHGPWIEEVWANYLSNAMKYGGKPPRLELGVAVESTSVRFWVSDNGPGIAREAQTRLFTPFTRLHQVRATGHGLGLSIVRRIMEKLGGEAWVESEPGQGCRFGFTLPRAAAAE